MVDEAFQVLATEAWVTLWLSDVIRGEARHMGPLSPLLGTILHHSLLFPVSFGCVGNLLFPRHW